MYLLERRVVAFVVRVEPRLVPEILRCDVAQQHERMGQQIEFRVKGQLTVSGETE